ncbi:peptidylprolyl isomerase [Nioella nitratireducens]|uniref:peptidylprolyl isomerase n=1 Tax=Nioella nitratireducens TaxID=1287720 RepID=UPI0008FCF8DE|nr:peptidylprolyl isomerase [Nioella nitratireducens]
MAERKKKKASDFIVWGLLLLLVAGLGGFGIGNFGGSATEVGRVGTSAITANEYSRAIQSELRAQSAQGGPYQTLSALRAAGIDRAILDGLVARAALAHEAGRMGLSVGDDEVASQIRSNQSFQGPTGAFDRDTYEYALSQAGYTTDQFEETIREDVSRQILQDAIVGGLTMPGTFAQAMVAFQTETRDFTIARVTEANLSAGLTAPTEGDLQTYYDENTQRFERPETRRITYAWITPDMIQDDMQISDEDLRALYQERISDYVQPERRLLERLVFPTQEEADAARAALDAGEADYDALIADRGLTIDDVDMGEVSARDLSDAAAELIFSDTESEILGPVESRFGPALFRINAVLDATEVPFEEAQADLRTELAEDAARRAIDAELETFDDLLASGATLEELAQETDMQLGTIDWTDGSDQGIAAYAAFGEAAAAAQVGDFPELTSLSDGGEFALRLDEVVAPTVPPLADITDEVTQAWRGSELRRRLEERANTIVGNLALSGALDDQNLTLATETQIRRQDFVPDTPPTLVAQVFQLNAPGDLVVIPGARAAFIVRLDAITPGARDDAGVIAMQSVFDRQISNAIAGDLFQAYGQALEADIGISLDSNVINAVNAQFP